MYLFLLMQILVQKNFFQKFNKKVRNEALQANELLNVKNLNFSELPAPRLDQYPIYKISNLIQKKIKKFKPDTVFIPSEKDIHTDHKIISQAALVALRPINEHKVKLILAYETLSETHWMNTKSNTFSPNHFEILNSENIKQKKKSFSRYKSQLKKFTHPISLKGIDILANFRGMQICTEYAEAFEVKMILG